jgi:hypothetical protein
MSDKELVKGVAVVLAIFETLVIALAVILKIRGS